MTREFLLIRYILSFLFIFLFPFFIYGSMRVNDTNHPFLELYTDEIIFILKDEEKKYISSLSGSDVKGSLHLGLGTYIRNKYLYSLEYQDLKNYMYLNGIISEEGMSNLMIYLVWVKLQDNENN